MTTAAQRHNARMDKVWNECMRARNSRIEPHREAFRTEASESRAIKYVGCALLAYEEASIDEDCFADIMREVADWLTAPDDAREG